MFADPGREPYLERAASYLIGIKKQYPQQPVIYYGGKTDLLHAIEEIADTSGILYDHIDVGEDSPFMARLIDALHKFSHVISENAKDQKCISLLGAFFERYHPEDKLEPHPVDSLMTGIF